MARTMAKRNFGSARFFLGGGAICCREMFAHGCAVGQRGTARTSAKVGGRYRCLDIADCSAGRWRAVRSPLGAAVDEPEKLGVEEEDGGGDNPGDDLGYAGICEFAHPGAIAGELNQGNDGEGQLKT